MYALLNLATTFNNSSSPLTKLGGLEVDLPSGVTIENRRGGSDVLSMMASDFATLKTSGT